MVPVTFWEVLMRVCLVEDDAASGLEPLTLTRPVHALLLGATTLADRILRAFKAGTGAQRRGCVIRPHLVMPQRRRDPNLVVNDRSWLGRGPLVVANSRWVPPQGFQVPTEDGPWVGLCDGKLACALV